MTLLAAVLLAAAPVEGSRSGTVIDVDAVSLAKIIAKHKRPLLVEWCGGPTLTLHGDVDADAVAWSTAAERSSQRAPHRYSPTCGHCVKLDPVLDELAAHYADQLTVVKIDSRSAGSLSSRYAAPRREFGDNHRPPPHSRSGSRPTRPCPPRATLRLSCPPNLGRLKPIWFSSFVPKPTQLSCRTRRTNRRV